MRTLALFLLLSGSAYAETPKTIFVAIPTLKTDEAKAAAEIKRLLDRRHKEVKIVDRPDVAEFRVSVKSVEKRSAGQTVSPFVAGQLDDKSATVITIVICSDTIGTPVLNNCGTIEGDSSQQVIALGALDWAAQRVEEKIRKAIR